ncbi:hypothetical protein SAMN04487880_1995 [Marinobacter sp. es.042]|uniref:DUF6544 family protein n=1 Tax=Marinobacter sp. es.042 TaxID=1761794 RepID=UPI000B50EC66|nr:DUF6544 family protein [Marinobacter sp. es.042]SNB57157.1 hypothetical protein SAMN04487880_1995 [Marinobacter sp. es.042]
MKIFFLILLILVVAVTLALWFWRQADHNADQAAMVKLAALQPASPERFDLSLLEGLPEPARRYFRYTIQPGTPLYTVARILMTGKFGMGNRESPHYMDMQATQMLTVPEGFIWKMSASRGALRVSGSDTDHWTRFWLMGLLPVARMGGDPDHTRSAFGRYVAEAVFWTPAALLPGSGVAWQLVDVNTARVIVRHEGMEQAVDVVVADDGRPLQVSFDRWTNANAEKVHRLQPFGGYLSEFREFEGFILPTRVEAGNFFATDDYFPFFIGEISNIEFPRASVTGSSD